MKMPAFINKHSCQQYTVNGQQIRIDVYNIRHGLFQRKDVLLFPSSVYQIIVRIFKQMRKIRRNVTNGGAR